MYIQPSYETTGYDSLKSVVAEDSKYKSVELDNTKHSSAIPVFKVIFLHVRKN